MRGLVALGKRQSGWVVAAASLAAVGGMWMAGYGAEGADTPAPKTASVAAAPPGPCLQGAGDLGDTYYAGIGNGGYDVSHYDLNLKYNPDTKWLDGKATITAATTQHLCRFNLDLRGLTVSSVKVDGVSASFVRDGRELIITPPTPLLPSTGFVVEVLYAGEPGPAPRDPDGFLDGWNYTEYGAYTSTPPQGADTWYPNNNTTNDKAAFTFTVTVPADRQVMSNGILVSNTINEAAGTSTWVWDAPDPMATYLATLQIGKYTIQRYTTPGGLPIINGIRPGPADRAGPGAAGHDPRDPGLLRREVRPVPVRGFGRDRRSGERRLPDGAADAADLHQRERARRAGPRARAPVVGRQRRLAARPRRVVERGLRHVRRVDVDRAHRRHHRQAGVPEQLQPHRHVLEQHGASTRAS